MSETSPSPRPCPCGGGKPLASCCEPLLKQARQAETAEELMRSRFTAHVLHDDPHLHRTYLPTSREPFEVDGEPVRKDWTRLQIHAHEVGPASDSATVEFTAFYKEGDAEHSLIEKAAFQRIEGIWYYTRPIRQGPAPLRSTQAKVGRNDPCPCGSGRKFKQCCLGKA